jgi:hypothetical protein
MPAVFTEIERKPKLQSSSMNAREVRIRKPKAPSEISKASSFQAAGNTAAPALGTTADGLD